MRALEPPRPRELPRPRANGARRGRTPEPLASEARAAGGEERRLVVTAGPTRERIDPVRYLSNDSSGRMGFEIARAAAQRGWRVTLVAGPVDLETPKGVERVDVESASEMLEATRRAFEGADALFMAAAVSDWRPRRRMAGKWRAKDRGEETARLDLVRTPDILTALARRKGRRLVVGFALETSGGEARALRKLREKGADYIVLNDDSALNAARATVTILGRDGTRRRLEDRPKRELARALLALAATWRSG